MNRREFLSAFGLAAAALAYDHDRLLWVPESKTIFIPNKTVYEINTVVWQHPISKSVAFPMDADAAMLRYANAGYVKKYLRTVEDLIEHGIDVRGEAYRFLPHRVEIN